jgi:ubiquinone/menaquinone biosynthesis C-methylase UbiE
MTNEWDAAAPEYAASWETTTGYTVERLLDWLAPGEGTTFADVACGPGTVTVALLARGARVHAVDFSAGMIEELRTRVDGLGLADRVESDVADAASLPLGDDSVDGAVSNFGVIFCPDIDAALRELVRVTKPGGRLAMTAWTTETKNGWTTLLGDDHEAVLGYALPPRSAYRWTSEDDFAAALARAGWRDVTLEAIEFPPPTYPTADDVRHAIETPATKTMLAPLTDEQRERLADYLVDRAKNRFGDGEVSLPRQAWLARASA